MKEVENLSKGTERGPGEGQISQEPQKLEGTGGGGVANAPGPSQSGPGLQALKE